MVKERVLRYDMIRIVAICMVLIIHASTIMVVFSADNSSRSFLFGSVCNGLGRAGVPLFFMLSGALLLNEDRSISARRFYKKSLLPIVFLLAFWLLFYATWRTFILPQISGTEMPAAHFVSYLLKLTGLYPHLWYLFALVGLYLAVPVLRLFVKRENKPYILGMIILGVLVQFLGTSIGFFTRNADYTIKDFLDKFSVGYANGYLTYFLIGWYLTTFEIKKKSRVIIYLAGATMCVMAILSVIFCLSDIPTITNFVMEANTFPALMYGVSVFLWINTHFATECTSKKWVEELSKATFGVYVLHVLFLDVLTNTLFRLNGFWINFPFMYLFLLIVLSGGLSLLIVIPMSKVKYVRKLFHY